MAFKQMKLDKVFDLCLTSLVGKGASKAQANSIAAMLTAAERDGCHSHGLHRLPAFLKGCDQVNKTAEPEVINRAAGSICVDGKGGFQPYAQDVGIDLLVQKTKANGIGMMAVTNTRGMSGAMWYLAEKMTDKGLISMVFANSPPYVAAHGGKRAVMGTNPMAFGWPRIDGKPALIWDQASSGMARGEIELTRQRGETVPFGVGLDKEGKPTEMPSEILNGGVQLPFGLHKGSNISIMVELLGAALVGTDLATSKGPNTKFDAFNRGLFVIAIDPKSPQQFSNAISDGEMLLGDLEAEHVRLPSSRRYTHRKEMEQTDKPIQVAESTYNEIMRLIEESPKSKL